MLPDTVRMAIDQVKRTTGGQDNGSEEPENIVQY